MVGELERDAVDGALERPAATINTFASLFDTHVPNLLMAAPINTERCCVRIWSPSRNCVTEVCNQQSQHQREARRCNTLTRAMGLYLHPGHVLHDALFAAEWWQLQRTGQTEHWATVRLTGGN